MLTAWGVRGVLKVTPLVDQGSILSPGKTIFLSGRRYVIESARWQKRSTFLKLEGLDDPDAAADLRDELLTVPEDELEPLPDGEYYRFQLIGLTVTTTGGEAMGAIEDVLTTGADDVYIVRGPHGEILVPATDEVVKQIDIDGRRMVIQPLPGLIPERPE